METLNAENIEDVARTDAQVAADAVLDEFAFRVVDVPPGASLQVGEAVVFNVGGKLCATQARCPHKRGPLYEGTLEGSTLTCPWHGAQFDVCTGAVLRGPATLPLETYQIRIEGGIGRIDPGTEE
jgi:nitrite reductase/ring-hydroxylating ferredoxin subunit